MIRSIVGMEQAEMIRPGYAIEYDFADPTQLYHSLETKKVENLFLQASLTVLPDMKRHLHKDLLQV